MSSKAPGSRPGRRVTALRSAAAGGRYRPPSAWVVSAWAVFFYAPTELTMGDLQRLFYFHISSWWLAFAAF